jgi:hypothetical protein
MRKYITTWALFFLGLVVLVFIFSLTSIKPHEAPGGEPSKGAQAEH